MTSKQKKGLRGSIDDVLGDLLGGDDDEGPVKVRSPALLSSRPSAALTSRSGKRSLLDDDFFSKLAEEAEKDEEVSDVSEADPAALLDSMKDIDDMDADLFSSKKKPSSAPVQRKEVKGGDKSKSTEEAVIKPSSAPASTARPYKKFSFLDDEGGGVDPPLPPPDDEGHMDGSLDDLLDDLEDKQKTMKKSESSSPVASQKTERKRDELTFDDEDDLMDALGFRETHKSNGNGATVKKESDPPPRARTKLDEILGRGTSPRLLERPVTGEKSSTGRAPLVDEEGFTFGSYQPTMASTPEERQSRRQSVRFSTEDVSAHSPEHKPKPSSRAVRPRSDWLGLKREEEEEQTKEEPKQPRQPVPESPKTPASPSLPAGEETPAPASLKPNSRDQDQDWLSGALSRRKTQPGSQSEERESKQEVTSGPAEDVVLSSKSNASRRRADEPPVTNTEHSRESTGISIQHNTSTETQHKPVSVVPVFTPAEDLRPAAPVTHTHTPLAADNLQQLLLQQQVRSSQLERDQNQMLLESVQQRHKQDTEIMENMHRARVKLLEESSAQRESRLRQENEDLAERLAAVTRVAEQERIEIQNQLQRRLTQSQQDRDREVERLRDLQRKSILEMKRDHEEQIQHLKKLKDEEIDAVTSATSQTRSLTAVIEQMELFSRRLGDLSSRVESSHEHTAQGLELGARQRDQQLRVLQERLSQQQREMSEERSRLKEVIAKMDTQLGEQQRQLEKERWRVTSEQAKAESSLRGLEEERRTMMQHFSMEREELERAKSALLEEQQSVMTHCAEERRKLAAEWSRFHTQEMLRQERVEREASRLMERDANREGSILSMAQEQADLKLRAGELKQKEESLQRERDGLETLRQELDREKEKLSATALRLKTRAQEVEAFSKLASERFEEGERALREARQVEDEHQARLRSIHAQLERLRQQEHSLQQERLRMTDHHRDMERLRHTLPVNPVTSAPLIADFSPALASTHLNAAVDPLPGELHARLALIKHTAEKDRDFLQEEQYFLDTLKKTSFNT
ncbi:fas-binding factor 1 homolog [Pimephales promelas]|uniref:fas-binding factor 1 homolog n=1 Tax=Pimephales promelas TaxID=90988 RepID=UPI00195595BC|nr:fas-binding factor 1 homolog [Pimephales promelas]